MSKRAIHGEVCHCNARAHGLEGVVSCILCKMETQRQVAREQVAAFSIRRAQERASAQARLAQLYQEVTSCQRGAGK